MKKPPKYLLLAYLSWCVIHILIGTSTLLGEDWTVDGDIWPFVAIKLDDYYDIVEILIYCGLPIIIWAIYSKILTKYYNDK